MFKNVASQKLVVFAFDSTTNLPKTGDSANITAYVSKDFGTVTVLDDTTATEMDATNAKGYYLFDLTQAETNADCLTFSAKSGTSNIVVIAVPAVTFTTPANFSTTSIDSSGRVDIAKIAGTAQTAGDVYSKVSGLTFTVANKLDANVYTWNGTAVAAPNTAGVPLVDTKYVTGTLQTARDLGASVLLSSGTGTGQVSLSSGTVTVGTNNDKTGYALSSAGVQAIWDALTSALTTVGSIGKLLVTNIDAAISSRSTYAGGDTSGTTTLLSRLTSGRATNLDNLDAAVSTRLATSGYTAPLDAAGTRSAVGLASANLDTQIAAIPTANANADALLDRTAGVETNRTLRQTLRLMAAVLLGKVSGGGTGTEVFRDTNDSKDRVTSVNDANGNRTSVTYDAS